MNKYDYTEALELNKNGLSIMEISRKIGIPKTNLQKFFSYYGIDSNKKHFCKYDKNEIFKLNDAGLSMAEISKETGAGYHSIYSVLDRSGKSINKSDVYYDYDEIRKLAKEGYTVKEISKTIGIPKKYLYGLSVDGVFDINQ